MAKGSGPIQYNDLFANDVQAKLTELNALATTLDYSFQELAKSITGMSGRVNVQIKSNASTLKEMANNLESVDVAARGANTALSSFGKDVETAATKARNFRDQQEGLNKVFNISTASVDQIKAQIKLLTAEYTALGRVTDADKAKLTALSGQVVALKNQQEVLTSALNKTKTAIVAADGSYNQMSQRLAQLRKDLAALPNAINPATGAINKTNAAAMAYQKEIVSLDASIKKFDASLGVHGRNVGNYTGALGGAINQLATFAAGYLSIQAAMQAVTATFNTAVRTDAIRSALEFTFRSAEVADQKLQMLQKTADRLGLDFIALADSYKSFAGAAMASNFPIAQTEKIFNAVANAGSRLKLTSDQMSGALLALQQMISKGNVQAEELRGQLGERIPGAFSIAARAMGVTESELNKLLKSGDVLAKDLLPKLADELNRTFGGGVEEQVNSLQGSVNRLKNTFTEAVSDSDASRFFQSIVDGASYAIESIGKLLSALVRYNDRAAASPFALTKLLGMQSDSKDLSAQGRQEMDQLRGVGVSNAERIIANNTQIEGVKRLAEEQKKLNELYKQYNYALAFAKDPANTGVPLQSAIDKTKTLTREIYVQTTSVNLLKDAYKSEGVVGKEVLDSELNSVKEIQKRISELKGMTGSATAGSEIDQRIKALQARLKELNSKDNRTALDILNEKIKDLTDSLNLQALAAIQAGKSISVNPKTLSDLAKLQGQLEKLNTLTMGDLNGVKEIKSPKIPISQQFDNIGLKTIGNNGLDLAKAFAPSLEFNDLLEKFAQASIAGNEELTKVYQTEIDKRIKANEAFKESLHSAFDALRQSGQVIGELFGQEFGNLFDSLLTDIEKFAIDGSLSFEDMATVAIAGARAIDEAYRQGTEYRIEQLEMEKQAQIDIAGTNAVARLNIEKEYNDKIKAEKKKQAQIDKAAAVFEIAINTAVAISKTLAETALFGIPLIPIIAALGAVQIAAVLARPIPGFFKGRESGPATFAEVNERGAEILEHKGDMRIVAGGKRAVTYLRKDEKVLTADQTRKRLDMMLIDNNTDLHSKLSNNLHRQSSEQRIKEMSIAFRQDPEAIGNAVGKQIKGLPIHQTNFDERGVTRFLKERNTRTQYLNDRNSLQ